MSRASLVPTQVPVARDTAGVTEPSGFRAAGVAAGLKQGGALDVALVVNDGPAYAAAAVLTRNRVQAAPVVWTRRAVGDGTLRAVVLNSGGANACTGAAGEADVVVTTHAVAAQLGCAASDVAVCSTGLIGVRLPIQRLAAGVAAAATALQPTGGADAARAIMTTDTYPKLATRKALIGDVEVTINGFCKGAGMIAPDMATMLCFIFTDAAVESDALQELVSKHAETTFNCMTIDGDTSTSDTCLAFATGTAAQRGQKPAGKAKSKKLAGFSLALRDLMADLAIQVAKDGEGLSKFVTFDIEGAKSWRAARTIARACANSPILKAAIAGEDPNWGRVVMAVGKSGEAADRDKLTIWFGPHCVARDGERAAEYDEKTVAAYMKNRDIVIRVHVGVGKAAATVWTCDLTHDYISINADYRS